MRNLIFEANDNDEPEFSVRFESATCACGKEPVLEITMNNRDEHGPVELSFELNAIETSLLRRALVELFSS